MDVYETLKSCLSKLNTQSPFNLDSTLCECIHMPCICRLRKKGMLRFFIGRVCSHVCQEGHSPRQHLEYKNAQCPPVHSPSMTFALNDFWGEIFWCPTESPCPVGVTKAWIHETWKVLKDTAIKITLQVWPLCKKLTYGLIGWTLLTKTKCS
jgi:hypothetical protein